ncbi:exported protein of unknown function [Pseudodesulfovibrio profundus]|uniref:Lipoprotein n=1 Tax=Pseudodesulfovibrio profundus TaxID=57320 RepID=A0A2C8FAR7_9BACT|nr:hypothetical protein [Pseudodesulfovibrio profundus]SOB59644.1 exported protein of unknown function [Pseudodesulfovibrio profundus]
MKKLIVMICLVGLLFGCAAKQQQTTKTEKKEEETTQQEKKKDNSALKTVDSILYILSI